MLPLRDLNDMEDLWGLRSAGALMNLPSTGVSVLRWTRKTAGPFQFDIETSQDFMMFSMVLLPMDACSRVDDTVIWDGPIEGGSVRLIDSRTIERTGFESPSPFDLLHIHFSLGELRATARRFGIDFEDFEPRDGPLYRDDRVGRLLGAQLVAALDADGAAGRMYADGIAQSLVAHLLRSYGRVVHAEAPPAHEGLQAAFDHVERHPHEPLSVARLARLAEMSEFHFARRFKQRYGLTPHAHLVAARLRLAKADLAFSDKNILQIAMDCGFSDSSHLARLFRRTEGMTPQVYRQARRQ
ncbi:MULTISPECIES: helix-turn-helix domain-containing protein [unclassified Variovorax]|jgi:AraC family transcriptional regulator|uniref:helix-turn-helix domain-containing protein n=1 Tax=Variovorax TaxID=34072 RepID=UPI0008E4EE9E|nr:MULTISPECIES: AraC family transcriptional regulator [unclassified Variovorax]MCT8180290.1 AraC family transcriptional regulator [Variovorax sp. CY25R-8]TAJ56023.1 MAG: AraC family transcriptional regulator [Variovorax sp.]SFQ18546.1 AraC-type DNA-binding protein [Variovorax sp. PDC80]